MRVIIVLIVITAVIADTSNVADGAEETTTHEEHDVTSANANSSEERRWMRPIFPKTTQFTSTIKSIKTENSTSPVNGSSKKPAFKIVSKAVKMKSKNYWKTATSRPSLMKYTKFTVDPLNSFNRHSINSKQLHKNEDIERKYKSHESRKTNGPEKDDSSDETEETSTANEKRKAKVKHVKTLIRRFYRLGSKINNAKYDRTTTESKESDEESKMHKSTTERIKPSESEFSSEEKEDREEFIFVTPKIIRAQTVRVTEDSDESVENTTAMIEKEPRQKRSVNVIEEENLGTTVSGFKFTGKVASLSNNLVFRNINN